MIFKTTASFLTRSYKQYSGKNVLERIYKINLCTSARLASKTFREYESFGDEMRTQKAITIPEFFESTVNKFGERPALMHKDVSSNKWKSITYKEYHKKVEKIAKAFIKLGLEHYGSVSVLAFNCPEWFISQLAAIHAGGQIVGIYTSNSPEACHFILESSRSNIVIVDDSEQLEKIMKVKDRLPHLKAVVKILPSSEKTEENLNGIYSWETLEAMKIDDVEDEYKKRLSSIKTSDCCSICYTSGTTGNPKGVLLTHDNQVVQVNIIEKALQSYEEGKETVVSFLPLAHMSGQNNDLYLPIKVAATVYFADRNAFKGTLLNTVKEVQPTYFGAVPRIYEKIYEKLQFLFSETRGVKKFLLDWARKVTLQYHLDRLNGHKSNGLQYLMAKKFVLDKVKHGLGFERTKLFLVGASPISLDVTHFFMSLDIPLLEVYGMTENTGIAFIRAPWHDQLQSVGKVLPGLETKILNPNSSGVGEICTRGRTSFKGYINDVEKTKQTFDNDGWLRSGDLGHLDEKGYLYITGRIKELVITAGGENIPFLHIENLVKKECAAISNAFLIGDKRKFLSMLITFKTELDENNIPTDNLAPESLKLMKDLNLKFTKMSEVENNPKVVDAIQAAVDRANKNSISNAQKVQKFAILPHEFSLPTGELSPTMKLKRGFVEEKYKNIIEEFYS